MLKSYFSLIKLLLSPAWGRWEKGTQVSASDAFTTWEHVMEMWDGGIQGREMEEKAKPRGSYTGAPTASRNRQT